MPTYFLNSRQRAGTFTRLLFSLQNVSSTLVIPVNALSSVTLDFVTPDFYPNTNSFTTTSSTLVLTHTVTNMSMSVNAQIHRLNTSGSLVASGTAVSQTTAATNTFTNLDDPTWGTTCSDRILLRLIYTNASMGAISVTLGLDRTTTYLNSTISINSGTCPILRKVDLSI